MQPYPGTSTVLLVPTRQQSAPRPNWTALRQRMKENNVKRNVKKFVRNMKQSIIKQSVPEKVQCELDSNLYKWEDQSSIGWNSQRLDVLLLDFITAGFHFASIFLFGARVVLPYVMQGVYPLVYLGILALSCFYKLNTQIHVGGNTLVHKTSIRSYYIRWQLLLDVTLAVLCFLEYFKVPSGVFRLVIFFKLIELQQIHTKFDLVISNYSRKAAIYWRVVNLLALNMVVAHILVLILIGMVNPNVTPNWMASLSISRNAEKWTVPYIWAFYWGTTIMSTIGFGDITPKNPKEVLIVTFVEMFGVILFAYFINSVQGFLTSLRELSENKDKNLFAVNRYMRRQQIDPDLEKEVKKSVLYASDTAMVQELEEQNRIINSTHPNMRKRLLEVVNFRRLCTMSLWNRLSISFVKQIAVELERKMYYKSEIVIEEGNVPDKFHMLVEGCLRYSITKPTGGQMLLVDHLEQRKEKSGLSREYLWVSLAETVKQHKSRLTVESKGFSVLLSMPVEQVTALLQGREEDYQAYCSFRDKHVEKIECGTYASCSLCDRIGHDTIECPYSHYVPKSNIVVSRYLRSKQLTPDARQRRRRDKRKHRRRIRWARIARMHSGEEGIDWRLPPELVRQARSHTTSDLSEYLTTVPDVDTVHQWNLYQQSFNLSSLTKRNSGRQIR